MTSVLGPIRAWNAQFMPLTQNCLIDSTTNIIIALVCIVLTSGWLRTTMESSGMRICRTQQHECTFPCLLKIYQKPPTPLSFGHTAVVPMVSTLEGFFLL